MILHPFDLLAVSLYGLFLVMITVLSARNSHSFRSFSLADGDMPWGAVGVSLIATSISASTFLGSPADVYVHDMRYLMLQFGVLLSLPIVWFFFIPALRKAEIPSAYALLEKTFGATTRKLAALFYIANTLLRTSILIYGPSWVFAEIFNIPVTAAILLVAAVSILYTWFGGLKAVIWTDVLQFLVLFFAGIASLIIIMDALGGPISFWHAVQESPKSHWWDSRFALSDPRTIWAATFGYVFYELAFRGCDQQFVQRYLACKSVKQANFSSLLSIVLGFLSTLLFFFIGAGLFLFFQQQRFPLPPGTPGDRVFPWFIAHHLPPGLTGLVLAGLFSAAMSSLDSAMSALSHTVMLEFSNRPPSKEASRRWVLLWGLLGTAGAMFCIYWNDSLLTKAYTLTSFFIGPLLAMFLMAFFLPFLKGPAVTLGCLFGALTLLALSPPAFLPWAGHPWHPAWPFHPLISTVASLAFSLFFHATLFKGNQLKKIP
jgi:SSS family solute:Na+ symporter